MNVHIPASWVSAGYGVPEVCSRHGEPAANRRKTRLISRPPGWSFLLLIAGPLPFLIVVLVLRKTVEAPAWPFCLHCRARRNRCLGIGLGLIGFSVFSFAALVALDSDSVVTPLLLFGGLFAFFAGVVIAAQSAPPNLARAHVSGDGQWVLVSRAHQRFADRVHAAQVVASPAQVPSFGPSAQPGFGPSAQPGYGPPQLQQYEPPPQRQYGPPPQ